MRRFQYLFQHFQIKAFFLITLCILYYVFLFLSPENSSTYFQVERRFHLCNLTKDYKPLDYAPSTQRSCPKNGIVTAVQGGRLGNQIWEYAAVWLTAKKTGLEPFVPSCIISRLSTLLDNLNLPVIEDIRNCLVENRIGEGFANSWRSNRSLVLPIYAETPDLLGEYIGDINKIFTIKKSLLHEGQEVLKASVKILNLSVETFVGVHVRRTDYIRHLKNLWNVVPANITTFIKGAMAHFEKKHPNSVFIFVSDDPDWCFKTFGSKSNVYISAQYHDSSPELDLAIMASCNHSIIDYGTYGQWGALFAGGETVFYHVDEALSSETLSRHLKRWHPLKDSDILDFLETVPSVNNSVPLTKSASPLIVLFFVYLIFVFFL